MDTNKIYAKPYYDEDEVNKECNRLNNDDSLFEDMPFASCIFAQNKRIFETRYVTLPGEKCEWRICAGEYSRNKYRCKILNMPCGRMGGESDKDCSDCNIPLIFTAETNLLLND